MSTADPIITDGKTTNHATISTVDRRKQRQKNRKCEGVTAQNPMKDFTVDHSSMSNANLDFIIESNKNKNVEEISVQCANADQKEENLSEKNKKKLNNPKTVGVSVVRPEVFQKGKKNTQPTIKHEKRTKEIVRVKAAEQRKLDIALNAMRKYKREVRSLPPVDIYSQMFKGAMSSITPDIVVSAETMDQLTNLVGELNKKKIVELTLDPKLQSTLEEITSTFEGLRDKIPSLKEVNETVTTAAHGCVLSIAKYASILFAVLSALSLMQSFTVGKAGVLLIALAAMLLALDAPLLTMVRDKIMSLVEWLIDKISCKTTKTDDGPIPDGMPALGADEQVEYGAQMDTGNVESFLETVAVLIFGYTVGTSPDKTSIKSFMRDCSMFTRSKDGFKDVAKLAITFFEKVINWIWHDLFKRERIVLVESEVAEVRIWTKECLAIHEEMRAKEESKRFTMSVANADRVHNLWSRGNALMSKYTRKDTAHVKAAVSSQMQYISRLKLKFEQANILAQTIRQVPLTLCINGPSGVGKSAATPLLAAALLARLLPEELLDEFNMNYETFLYNRQNEHVYWDGYRGQFMVVFDDWLQVRDTQGVKDNEYMDVIRSSNLFPFVLHMAELESKGVTTFCSKVLLCTTNKRNFNVESISEAEAVGRRFDFIVTQVPPPIFCVDSIAAVQGTNDIWKRRLDITRVNTAAAGFDRNAVEYHEFKYQPDNKGFYTGKVWTFDQFVEECIKCFRKKEAEADQFSSSIQAVKNEFLNKRPDGAGAKYVKKFDSDVKVKSQMGKFDFSVGSILQKNTLPDPEEALVWKNASGKPPGYNAELLKEAPKAVEDFIERVKGSLGEDVFNELFKDLRSKSGLDAHDVMCVLIQESDHIANAINTITERGPMNLDEHKIYYDKNASNIVDVMIRVSNLILLDPALIQDFLLCVRITMTPEDFTTFERISLFASRMWEGIKDAIRKVKNSISGFLFNDQFNYITGAISMGMLLMIGSISGLLVVGAIIEMIVKLLKMMGFISADFGVSNGELVNQSNPFEAKSRGNKHQKLSALKAQHAKWISQGASLDPVLEQISNKIVESNMYELCSEKGARFGYVLFVKERIFLMPFHFLTNIAIAYENEDHKMPFVELRSCGKSKTIIFKIEVGVLLKNAEQTTYFGSSDLVLVRASVNVPPHKDITAHFADLKNLDQDRDPWFYLPIPSSKEGVATIVHSSRYHMVKNRVANEAKDGELTILRGYEYEAPTVNGDCGALVYSHDPKMLGKRIIGMHVAGNEKARRGLATSITRSELEDCLNLFKSVMREESNCSRIDFNSQMDPPLGNFQSVGKVVGRIHSACDTAIMPSQLHNTYTPSLTKPAYLRPFVNTSGERVDPYTIALRKYCTDDINIDAETVTNISESLGNDIRRSSRKPFIGRILSFEEAVAGIEGDDCYGGLPRSTSPGFPHVLEVDNLNPGKKAWFGHEGPYIFDTAKAKESRDLCDLIIAKARENVRLCHVFVDCLKDERRPILKVDQGKTRLFSACPMEYAIVVKQYFGSFTKYMIENRIHNGSAVGINPYSDEWELLSQKLQTTGTAVGAGDYSGFDGSEKPLILWAILEIINSIYNDGEENALVRKILWEDLINSKHVRGDNVYSWCSSLPSGHPLTVHVNNMYNMFAFRYCWYRLHDNNWNCLSAFSEHVYLIVFGDDNVFCVSSEKVDIFNQNTISEQMKTIGLTYTDELKNEGDVPMRSLYEVSFLKRKFRVDNFLSKRHVAPLELNVILEMPMWTKKKRSDRDQIVRDNVDTALMELALHPKKIFVEWAPKIVKTYTAKYRFGLPLMYTSYLDCLRRALVEESRW